MDQVHGRDKADSARTSTTSCRCASNCRPTTWPACGPTTPSASGTCLEEGDVEEAINAATAIGDDRLQMEAQGYTVPESFTHGTSEQRVRWFYKGLQSGDMDGGDTFEVREL